MNKTIKLLERKGKQNNMINVMGMRYKIKYHSRYIICRCGAPEREMTTVSRERVGVDANSCCLSLLDNRVLGLSNFFLTLSFSLPLYLTNHPFLSLIFSVSIYIVLVLSSSRFPLPPQFYASQLTPHRTLLASLCTHSNKYIYINNIYILYIPVVI